MVAVKLDSHISKQTKVSRFVKDAAIFDSSYLFSHFS